MQSKTLDQSRESLLTITDFMPFGVIVVDSQKRIRYVNAAALATMGYESEDQVVGLLCHDTLCPADADRCPIYDLGQSLDRSERILVKRDSTRVPILKSAVPITLEGENVLLEAFVDITERRAAEEGMRQLSRAVEATNDAVIVADAEGFVQFVNSAFERITGHSRDDALGQSLRILRSNELSEEMYIDLWNTISSGRVWEGRVTNQHQDGTLSESELTVSPVMNGDGDIEQYIAIQRDVTRQVELQREIGESLERRGRQVQTITEVAQEIAAAPALDELFRRVVTLVKERFGYYHVLLFLLDEAAQSLTTVSGYGEVGERLAREGYRVPLGKGVIGRAGASSLPLLSSDVSIDPEWIYHPLLPDTKGELAVPIVLRGQVLGVLDVQSDIAGALDEEDQVLLVALAGQIASIIEAQNLFQRTQVALAQTEALYTGGQRIVSSQTMEQVLNALVESTVLSEYDRADLMLFDRPMLSDEKPEAFTIAAVWERDSSQPGAPVGTLYSLARYPEGQIITRGMPLIVSDITADDRLDPNTRDLMHRRLGVQSLLFWPVAVGEQWIGMLSAQSSRPLALDENDTDQLSGLIGQAATAIQNQRLLRLAEHRALWMQTAAEVSRAASSILNLDALLPQVVELICERFDLYYVGIFLVDEAGRNAVLQAGSGEAGYKMLEAGHSLPVGDTSMIGSSIAHLEPRIALDVGAEAVRFDNPLLPETRTELALPLVSRGVPVGAMTIQSAEESAFSEEDISILQTMADQLATGIQNARLFEEAQRSLQEVETAHRQYLREGWAEFVRQADPSGPIAFEFTPTAEVSPVEPQETPELRRVLSEGQTLTLRARGADISGSDGASSLVAPISLRGEPIGAFVLEDPNVPREWSDDDIALVETVSSQVAMALESARLFQQTRAEAGRRALINEVMQAAASSLDVDSLLHRAGEAVSRRLGLPSALYIVEPLHGTLRPVAMHDSSAQDIALPSDIDVDRSLDPTLVEVAETRGTRLVEIVPSELGEPFGSLAQQLGLQAAIYVPLVSRGRTRGVLQVFQEEGSPQLGEQEMSFSEVIASNLSVALENARLFQEAVETAERLQEVDRLKSQFLANMSHELRTPLNSIIGFSRVILKGIDGPLTDLQQQDLEAIYNSGQHLLGLINDILDISKIEAGKMELAFEPGVDVGEIVNGVMSTAIAFVKDLPVELQQALPDDLPTITADSRRVRQVLLNLVNNACKFTEEGYVRVEGWVEGGNLLISVKDTGIGIPEDKIANIFEAFTQADASPSRKYGGTGLGLTISKSFVNLHGGDILIDSQVGSGSTFTVVLPIAGPPPPQEEDTLEGELEEDIADGISKLVLCVDDDEGVITLFRRYLEKQGYQVVGLTDATRTLEEARRLDPFAITLDVMMPGKDGWEVIKELKDDRDTQHIPVIMCTIISERDRGLTLGASDYLVKPVLERDLLASLDRLDREAGQHLVLVVDDQEEDRKLLRRMIESHDGYEVIEASGGSEAIALVKRSSPHIIVLDLIMPGVDGFAVLEEVKADPSTRPIPIIVVTAKDLTEQDRKTLNSRIGALIQKGVLDREELLEDVSAALQKLSRSYSG